MKKLILIFISLISFSTFAGEDELSPMIGPDKGITERKDESFKLSPEAIKTLEVEVKPYGGGTLIIDRKAIVFTKNDTSIFRMRDGWFERIDVKIVQKMGGRYLVTSEQLKNGDQYAVSGVNFLRIAELSTEEGAEQGHAH